MGQDESKAVSESFVPPEVNCFETGSEDAYDNGIEREMAAGEC